MRKINYDKSHDSRELICACSEQAKGTEQRRQTPLTMRDNLIATHITLTERKNARQVFEKKAFLLDIVSEGKRAAARPSLQVLHHTWRTLNMCAGHSKFKPLSDIANCRPLLLPTAPQDVPITFAIPQGLWKTKIATRMVPIMMMMMRSPR